MTTTVIVKANHGWPVDVTPKPIGANDGQTAPTTRVAPDTEQTFYVHSGQDLHIHEVQPEEIIAAAAAASAAPADAETAAA